MDIKQKNFFPFKKIRPCQKEFLEDVKAILKQEKHLIAHAPTGIGKTAAVLSPSLEYSLSNGKTIFFLTPKHTQHKIVIDTLRKIKKRSKVRDLIGVDFIGKQWMCPYPKVRELSSREFNEFCRAQKRDERCKFYKNVHKRRLSKNTRIIIEKIQKETLHSEEIKNLCEKNSLCPYEICIKAGKDANVVVCDYFHIFSPNVRKAFLLKLEKKLENSILIIDEAHNLPERVRKLLSYSLSDFTIKRAIKEANFLSYDTISESLKDVQTVLRELSKGMKNGDEKFIRKDEFIRKFEENADISYDEFQDMLDYLGEEVLRTPKRYRSYSKSIARFLENWKEEKIGYCRILTKGSKGKGIKLSYKCLDPGVSSKEIFQEVYTAILMSGTLVPLEMYVKILDLDENKVMLKEYASPFPKENRLILLVKGVTTQYKKRSEIMYKKYAEKISKIIENIPKNLAIFFPSYEVMNLIIKNLEKIDKEILLERKDMKKEERINLYNKLLLLTKLNGNGGILAGVQAGSFSEGVDYPENLLDGVIIVGLPLETPNLEVKALIEYYDFKFSRGWDYGYIYPAMNRALQAAGRCIRSEKDRGVIILMDERFKWRNYAKCFPKDFSPIVTEFPEKYVKGFFQESKEEKGKNGNYKTNKTI